MGVPLGEAGVFGRIQPGIHAGEDGEMASRRHGQFTLAAKLTGVGCIGRENFFENYTLDVLLDFLGEWTATYRIALERGRSEVI
jgi:hypothetical protein